MSGTGSRVTLVVNNVDEGSETFLHSMASALRSDGREVTVHGMLDGRSAMPAAELTYAGIRRSMALPALRSARFPSAAAKLAMGDRDAVTLAMGRARRRFGLNGRAVRAAALAAPVLATRPDIVHLGFSGIGVVLLDALELLDGVRVIVSCRGSGELVRPVVDPSSRGGLAALLGRADAVHAVSDAVGDAVVEIGAAPGRVTVIRPAVDTARFTRQAARTQIGQRVRLVTVARLHWVKALDVQLGAVARLRSDGHDVELRIVGGGPELDQLRYRAVALGIEDCVNFLGRRSVDQIVELVQSSDIFVLSSLSEGTSNAALEAMSLEVPVISTAVGGMTEVITDGVDGVLVPPGDPDSIARAVVLLSHDPELAAGLASEGRRRVLERFSSERQRRDISALYAEVTAGLVPASPGGHKTEWGRV